MFITLPAKFTYKRLRRASKREDGDNDLYAFIELSANGRSNELPHVGKRDNGDNDVYALINTGGGS